VADVANCPLQRLSATIIKNIIIIIIIIIFRNDKVRLINAYHLLIYAFRVTATTPSDCLVNYFCHQLRKNPYYRLFNARSVIGVKYRVVFVIFLLMTMLI